MRENRDFLNIQNEMRPIQTQDIGPIACPRCGSRELAFVAEYHKALFLRTVEWCLVVLLFYIGISNIQYLFTDTEEFFRGFLSLFIAYALIHLAVFLIESKTHVQAICKDCSNLWLLN